MARNSRSLVRRLAFPLAFLVLMFAAVTVQAQSTVPLPATPDWVSEEMPNGACLVWGDLDGDGDLDTVPGAVQAGDSTDLSLLIYLNRGIDARGRLQFSTQSLPAGAVTACTLGDLDRDGRLDLVVGMATGPTRIFLNGGLGADGSITWTDQAWADRHPADGLLQTTAVTLGDMNGDGWLDLAVGAAMLGDDGTYGSYANYAYVNEAAAPGAVALSEVWASAPGGADDVIDLTPDASNGAGMANALAWGDIDGDGKVDALAAGGRDMRIYPLVAGQPAAEPAMMLPASAAAIDWGDMNRNGLRDLAVGSAGRLAVYSSARNGEFGDARTWPSNDAGFVSSLSWGDVDNDGDADLAVGYASSPAQLYLNEGAWLGDRAAWSSAIETADNTVIAWADVDGDGDLDLGQVDRSSMGGPVLVYLNRGRPLPTAPFARSAPEPASATAAAWGDVDGDGRLELAVGRSGATLQLEFPWSPGHTPARSRLYRLNGATLEPAPDLWDPAAGAATTSLAWGDVDGDGDLDLAVGNAPVRDKSDPNNPQLLDAGASQVYLNRGKALEPLPAIKLGASDTTAVAVAWGDVDGDGSLDLVVGNYANPTRVYFNRRTADPAAALDESHAWSSKEVGPTSDIALGDLNNDGALDLVVAHYGPIGALWVYMNQDGSFETAAPYAIVTPYAYSLALGDMDRDGYLDLAVGTNGGRRKLVYRNQDGRLQAPPAWSSGDFDSKSIVAWGDVNGDGYPDLAAGNPAYGQGASPSRVYLNQRGMLATAASWSSEPVEKPMFSRRSGTADHTFVAWGDANGDGRLDLAAVSGTAPAGSQQLPRSVAKLYLNRGPGSTGSPTGATNVSIDLHADRANSYAPADQPGVLRAASGLALADFYATAPIRDAGVISITFRLTNTADAGIRFLRAFYSLDGGGSWLPANTSSQTNTIEAADGGSLAAGAYVYPWDVLASGFLGESDNVVFRLEAYPGLEPTPGGIANSYRSVYAATQTYPFRVRGSRVRVLNASGGPAKGALVYRLPAGSNTGGLPIGAEQGGSAFKTDAEGYLQGAGQIQVGDRLVALQPVTPVVANQAYTYTLYTTSPPPTGPDAYIVSKPGSQTLTTSNERPLALFDLDVSLEWDARRDGPFLDELARAFQQSSELLYQVTNGQAALGNVRIYQNQERWSTAHVVMYADNGVRPSATIGGIVTQVVSDTLKSGQTVDAFAPGQIRVGPNWDPFGESRADLGPYWWRALAHEYGHYMLFMPDSYLGLNASHYLTKVDCKGSFMTTAYDPAYEKFLTFPGVEPSSWGGNCNQTLAANSTGRSDWATIAMFYPELRAPVDNTGAGAPGIMPLDLTEVTVMPVKGDPKTMPAANFDLRLKSNGDRQAAPQGRAYLFKTQRTPALEDDRVIALGATGNKDFVKVRGAEPGDLLCVLDNGSDTALRGCEELKAWSTTVALSADYQDWRPNVELTPFFRPSLIVKATWPNPGGSPRIVPLTLRGPTPDFKLTDPTEGRPYYELQLSTRPTSVMTFTKPITDGQDYLAVILEPALAITVTQALEAGGELKVQVFPDDHINGVDTGVTAPYITLQASDPKQPNTFAGVIPLDAATLTGYARVWAGATPKDTARIAMSQFFFNPVWRIDGDAAGFPNISASTGMSDTTNLSESANLRGGIDWRVAGVDFLGSANLQGGVNMRGGVNLRGGVNMRGGVNLRGGVNMRGGAALRDWNANTRLFSAPMSSADAQVTVLNASDIFTDTATDSFQALAPIPNLPAWLTPVGQGYRYTGKAGLARNIAFNYLQRDVPEGQEFYVRIYYSDDEGKNWAPLAKQEVNRADNLAVAPMPGSGLYVLATSIEVRLSEAGWNRFTYQVAETRPVTEALQSIDGRYSTVYAYDAADTANPWHVYDTKVPAWVNDLADLRFGRAYWINLAEDREIIRLAIPSQQADDATAMSASERSPSSTPIASYFRTPAAPPATYYGVFTPDRSQAAPDAEVAVVATIGQVECGRVVATPSAQSGELRYVIKVASLSTSAPGCGAPDRIVTFRDSLGHVLGEERWDNNRPIERNW